MADLPIGEWRQPSPAPSDHGSSSSDESTSYEEEVPTPPIEKKCRTEENEDPNYSPTPDRRPQHENLGPQHGMKQIMRIA